MTVHCLSLLDARFILITIFKYYFFTKALTDLIKTGHDLKFSIKSKTICFHRLDETTTVLNYLCNVIMQKFTTKTHSTQTTQNRGLLAYVYLGRIYVLLSKNS